MPRGPGRRPAQDAYFACQLGDGRFQAGNSIFEILHSGEVDNAKADPFAQLEDPRPILCRTLTVDERGETLQALNIRWGHPHFTLCLAVGGSVVETYLFAFAEEIEDRPLLAIIVIRHHLQVPHDAVPQMRMRVGQLDDVVPFIPKRLGALARITCFDGASHTPRSPANQ